MLGIPVRVSPRPWGSGSGERAAQPEDGRVGGARLRGQGPRDRQGAQPLRHAAARRAARGRGGRQGAPGRRGRVLQVLARALDGAGAARLRPRAPARARVLADDGGLLPLEPAPIRRPVHGRRGGVRGPAVDVLVAVLPPAPRGRQGRRAPVAQHGAQAALAAARRVRPARGGQGGAREPRGRRARPQAGAGGVGRALREGRGGARRAARRVGWRHGGGVPVRPGHGRAARGAGRPRGQGRTLAARAACAWRARSCSRRARARP